MSDLEACIFSNLNKTMIHVHICIQKNLFKYFIRIYILRCSHTEQEFHKLKEIIFVWNLHARFHNFVMLS